MYKNIIDLFTDINPIIQAPMAGVTNPRLVAAVSNSGAVGSFGFAYSSVEKIYIDLKEARELTKKPINANKPKPAKLNHKDESAQLPHNNRDIIIII